MTANQFSGARTGVAVSRLFFLTSLSFLVVVSSIHGGTRDELEALHKIYTKQNLRKLEFGNTVEKIEAARYFGGTRNPRFVRPLGKELLHGLNKEGKPGSNESDPYVKVEIASALATISHPSSLPYLLDGLDLTIVTINEERNRRANLEERYKNSGLPAIVLPLEKSGPALIKTESAYPASPDVYWDVADRFKSQSINPSEEGDFIRLKGYNEINQALELLSAIGKIHRENHAFFHRPAIAGKDKAMLDRSVDLLAGYISHPVAEIRKGVVLSMESIGEPRSMELLETRFKEEEDPTVRVAIARAILMNDKSRMEFYNHIVDQLYSDEIRVRSESAVAMRELSMGESVFVLDEAIKVEGVDSIRDILKEAHHNALIDNIKPVNY